MKRLGLAALALCGASAFAVAPGVSEAQEIIIEELDGLEDGISLRPPLIFEEITEEVRAVSGTGAVLRGLDKLSGQIADIELENGFSVSFGKLRIDLAECRHPEDNATGEAFAFLSIYDGNVAVDPLFQGWMIASSPALSAMDHARYDVWVLRCVTSAAEGNE
ncbi:hypothetical protein NBRC116601_04690 [Cognatishimia sp. WU-CL00825]|uniref:DUF2155 domain-containing protein n=1 Tax=Cognatishimia sp. WU-CL00825 TaxID=3127658 RepID=UPI003105FBD3